MNISRRLFMKKTGSASIIAGLPTIIPSSVLGRNGQIPPSDRVNVGLISCGDRSGLSINYQNYPKSQIIAVCDPIKTKASGEKIEITVIVMIMKIFVIY